MRNIPLFTLFRVEYIPGANRRISESSTESPLNLYYLGSESWFWTKSVLNKGEMGPFVWWSYEWVSGVISPLYKWSYLWYSPTYKWYRKGSTLQQLPLQIGTWHLGWSEPRAHLGYVRQQFLEVKYYNCHSIFSVILFDVVLILKHHIICAVFKLEILKSSGKSTGFRGVLLVSFSIPKKLLTNIRSFF